MNTAKDFGGVLARIRKGQGFPSAHKFFKGVGGSKSLGMSFVSYWDVERGKKLPKSWRLKPLMAALGIEPGSPKAQELLRAYFRALSGSDELLDMLVCQGEAGGDLPSRELAEAATYQAIAQRSMNLTIDQWRLRSQNLVTNICHTFLINTAGWVTVAELSAATAFKPADIRKALKALAAGGLMETDGDRARSPFAKKVVKPMPVTPATAGIKAALRDIWRDWLAGARLVDSKRLSFRMTKANLDKYRQHIQKAVDLACVYANSEESRADSAIYSVETSVFQLFPRNVAEEGGRRA